MSPSNAVSPPIRARVAPWGLMLAVLALCVPAEGQDISDNALQIVSELPGCVSAASVRARVRALMREQNWPSDLEIKLQLQAAQPSFSVSRSGNGYGERRFDRLPSACSEKRDAIAVAIVMALDDYRSAEPAAESGNAATALSETALADEPLPPPPVVAPSALATPTESSQLHDDGPARGAAALQPSAAGEYTLYAGGQWLWAAAPGAATALAAGMEWSLSRVWSVSAGGVWGPRAEHPLVDSKLLSAQIFAGQLLGCANVHGLPTILQGCLGTLLVC